jgi:hypothetical protein
MRNNRSSTINTHQTIKVEFTNERIIPAVVWLSLKQRLLC